MRDLRLALPLRDTILGFGDLGELFAHYNRCGGVPIDRQRIRFHRFVFGLSNALVCNGPLTDSVP